MDSKYGMSTSFVSTCFQMPKFSYNFSHSALKYMGTTQQKNESGKPNIHKREVLYLLFTV